MNAFPSLNSEEAKSTTWLHPVSGEAVITGHRKTPGKVSLNGGQVSLLCLTSLMFAVMCCCLPVSPNPILPTLRERGCDMHAVFLNA